jgi:hypothetical protein
MPILCERCRSKIPNPDPTVFDLDGHAVISVAGERRRLSPMNWAVLSLLISRVGTFVANAEIVGYTQSLDVGHRARQLRYDLRVALRDTGWGIENSHGMADRSAMRLVKEG